MACVLQDVPTVICTPLETSVTLSYDLFYFVVKSVATFVFVNKVDIVMIMRCNNMLLNELLQAVIILKFCVASL